MPELRDGESAEVQGSARQPYILKNVRGVYSCSCPAWRNQSLPIEQRSCKHLHSLRGEAAEAARVGNLPPLAASAKTPTPSVPAFLLAEKWEPDHDPKNWWLSEKLDGVRAWWDGEHRRFLSRQISHFWRSLTLPYPEAGVRLIRQSDMALFNQRMEDCWPIPRNSRTSRANGNTPRR